MCGIFMIFSIHKGVWLWERNKEENQWQIWEEWSFFKFTEAEKTRHWTNKSAQRQTSRRCFHAFGKLVWLSKLNVGRWSTKGPFPISSIAALVTLGCLWFCVFYPLKMEHLGGKNPLWTPAPRSVSGAKSTLGKSVDFTYSKDRQLPTEGICTTS